LAGGRLLDHRVFGAQAADSRGPALRLHQHRIPDAQHAREQRPRDDGAGAGEPAATSAGSMKPITSPTSAFSPLPLSTFVIVPARGAGNSTVALSLSISTIESSIATTSPSRFFQVPIMTSVIDSPTSGTFSSMAMEGSQCQRGGEMVDACLPADASRGDRRQKQDRIGIE
jgi:hypothetical protein